MSQSLHCQRRLPAQWDLPPQRLGAYSDRSKHLPAMAAEGAIWHDWDPFRQILKVAFVGEDGIVVFSYRLCPNCGVSMDLTERSEGRVWTCDLCDARVEESGEPW